MFKFFKEVFYKMARFVEEFVVVPLNFSVGFWRIFESSIALACKVMGGHA